MYRHPSQQSIIDIISFPSTSIVSDCACEHTTDIEYYKGQRKLIESTKKTLSNLEQKDILMIQLLNHLLRFLDKIQELSNKECTCKKDAQLQKIRSSYQFVKRQNDKLFKLLDQKNQQCQRMKRQVERQQSVIVNESRFHDAKIAPQTRGQHSKYFQDSYKDFKKK